MRSRLIVLAIAAALAACSSPEATRMRAGGPGGDVGNHGSIELHAGSEPYYGTPTSGPALVPRPTGTRVAERGSK